MIGCQSVSSSKYLQLWVSVTPGSPTPVPPTVRAGIPKRRKENIRIFYLIKRVSPRLPRCPGGPGPRLLRPGPRLLLASSLMSCCQPRPRPRAGSLINKELTQYDALANVTTRRQESLRSLYDSHIVGLEAGGGGRADPQLLGLEAGGGGRADPQLLGRDLHPLRKRNFSVWSQQRLCRSSTSRP